MGRLLKDAEARWGGSREVLGLELSPLKMSVYPLWLSFSGALTVRLSALPARYAIKPYADALYTLLREKGDMRYAMFKMLFGLSMGIPEEHINTCILDVGDNEGLRSVIVRYGELQTALMPYQMDEIRKAIAEMNGAELPDENDNAEIMQAEEDLKSLGNRRNLKLDLFDEIASVAAVSNLRMEEMKEMDILEYDRLKRAHNRRMLYQTCAMAESNGAKFKGGNPAPSWMFDKVDPDHGLVNLKKWGQQMGDAIKTGAPPGMENFMPK